MAPTSTPRVGCSAISTGASCDSSRATTTFWRLPPDSVPTGSFSLWMRMPKRAISVAGAVEKRGAVEATALGKRRMTVKTHREIVGGAGREGRADRGAILGDIGKPGLAVNFDAAGRDVDAVDADRAGVGRAETDQRFDELSLAVAGNAGYADDLAGADGEADLVDKRAAACRCDGQTARFEQRLRRLCRPAFRCGD